MFGSEHVAKVLMRNLKVTAPRDYWQAARSVEQATILAYNRVFAGNLSAGGGDRTHTTLRSRDFKSRASASSATPARLILRGRRTRGRRHRFLNKRVVLSAMWRRARAARAADRMIVRRALACTSLASLTVARE